jgi:hypothetical protein
MPSAALLQLQSDIVQNVLSVEEFAFFRDACVEKAKNERSDEDMQKLIMMQYRAQFNKTLEPVVLKHRLDQFSGLATSYRAATNFDVAGKLLGAEYAAMPCITSCLCCGDGLKVLGHEKGPTIFYDIGSHGKLGRLYVKECTECNIVYQLDGYQHKDNYLKGGGEKLMYTRLHEHHEWYRCVLVSCRENSHPTPDSRSIAC